MNICKDLLPYFLLFIILLLNISFTDSRNNARQSPPKDHKNPSESKQSHGDPKTNVVKCERRKSKGQVSNERSAENRNHDDRRIHSDKIRRFTRVLRRYTWWSGRSRETRPNKFNKCASNTFGRFKPCRRMKRGIKKCLNQLRRKCNLSKFPERYKAEILVKNLDNGRTRLRIPRKYGSLALLDYDQGYGSVEIHNLNIAEGNEGKGLGQIMVDSLVDLTRNAYRNVRHVVVILREDSSHHTWKLEDKKMWQKYGFEDVGQPPWALNRLGQGRVGSPDRVMVKML
ncbi:hypothetical protein Ddc_23189 [Ditylenchus destructor]|nr:hypothetical protein Ddc_23189 [Ditylenchus destructor]